MRPRRALRVLLGLTVAGAVAACSIDIAGTGETAPASGDSGPNVTSDATMPNMTGDDAMPAGDDDAPATMDAADDVTEPPPPDADVPDAAPDANDTGAPDANSGDASDGSDASDGGCDGSTCNRAASFTSSSQFIRSTLGSLTNEFTFEAFVKLNTASTSTGIFSANGLFCADHSGSGKDYYAGLYKSGLLGVNIGNGSSDTVYDTSGTTGAVVPTGQWTFVAVAHFSNSGTLHLYVGATETSASINYSGPFSDAPSLSIGGSGGADGFSGLIDEVRIYSDYRNGATVAADALKKSGPDTTGLVMYWKFNDAAGSTTASDSSGQNNPGTLMNGVTLVPSDLQ